MKKIDFLAKLKLYDLTLTDFSKSIGRSVQSVSNMLAKLDDKEHVKDHFRLSLDGIILGKIRRKEAGSFHGHVFTIKVVEGNRFNLYLDFGDHIDTYRNCVSNYNNLYIPYTGYLRNFSTDEMEEFAQDVFEVIYGIFQDED